MALVQKLPNFYIFWQCDEARLMLWHARNSLCTGTYSVQWLAGDGADGGKSKPISKFDCGVGRGRERASSSHCHVKKGWADQWDGWNFSLLAHPFRPYAVWFESAPIQSNLESTLRITLENKLGFYAQKLRIDQINPPIKPIKKDEERGRGREREK